MINYIMCKYIQLSGYFLAEKDGVIWAVLLSTILVLGMGFQPNELLNVISEARQS